MHDQETIAELIVCFGDLLGVQDDDVYMKKVVTEFDLIDHLHWALINCQHKS